MCQRRPAMNKPKKFHIEEAIWRGTKQIEENYLVDTLDDWAKEAKYSTCYKYGKDDEKALERLKSIVHNYFKMKIKKEAKKHKKKGGLL